MKYSKEQYFDIAKQYIAGEITMKEATSKLNCKRRVIYYWIDRYKESISEIVKQKDSTPKPTGSRTIRDEVANEDEISRLSSLSKEELIDEVIKAKVGEARAKKGYEVKGGGVNKEFVILSNKNTK